MARLDEPNGAHLRAGEGRRKKLDALAAQLDVIGTELRQLRHDLGDEAAKPWAPLALPAPA